MRGEYIAYLFPADWSKRTTTLTMLFWNFKREMKVYVAPSIPLCKRSCTQNVNFHSVPFGDRTAIEYLDTIDCVFWINKRMSVGKNGSWRIPFEELSQLERKWTRYTITESVHTGFWRVPRKHRWRKRISDESPEIKKVLLLSGYGCCYIKGLSCQWTCASIQ